MRDESTDRKMNLWTAQLGLCFTVRTDKLGIGSNIECTNW